MLVWFVARAETRWRCGGRWEEPKQREQSENGSVSWCRDNGTETGNDRKQRWRRRRLKWCCSCVGVKGEVIRDFMYNVWEIKATEGRLRCRGEIVNLWAGVCWGWEAARRWPRGKAERRFMGMVLNGGRWLAVATPSGAKKERIKHSRYAVRSGSNGINKRTNK